MRRESRRNPKRSREPHVAPVKRVELSEKHIRWRLALAVCLAITALAAFGYGISQLLEVESGWRTIEAQTDGEAGCAEEFVFQYNLGASGVAAGTEYRALKELYGEAMQKAYRLFNNNSSFEDEVNIYEINQHPNETLTVDEVLYRALEQAVSADETQSLYLAPIYRNYDNIFWCKEDYQIYDFDVFQNPQVREEFSKTLLYTTDRSHVRLELLEDYQICLSVSPEYLQYSQEYLGELNFIDFYWMKNAFIIDYLAEVLAENGYTCGSISSYDGFVRNLDSSGSLYSFNVYDREGNTVYPAAVMDYSGGISLVSLRNFPVNSQDYMRFYSLENGEIRTAYIDSGDGLCKSAVNDLISYSRRKGCSEILLELLPVYIADTLQPERLAELAKEEIYSLYGGGLVLYYNDSGLVLRDLYQERGIQYTSQYQEP